MINFTNITGLASSVLAITAISISLPGVSRLHKSHFVLLVCVLILVVLIPINGLPLAAYWRGWMGDLSITSLILLLAAIYKRFNRSDTVAKCKVSLLINGSDSKIFFSLILLAALGLYPMALGIGYFDPYRLGYGNPWFLGGLLLVALITCFYQCWTLALAIAFAVLAWDVGWYESDNLWDYLLDPFLAIYALISKLTVVLLSPFWFRLARLR
jgi:hypothetical protein